MELETDSGLAVVTRAVGDPYNPGRYVMYPEAFPPPEAQGWDGWPVGWAVPWSNYSTALETRVSTVFACVDLNARTLASFPPYIAKGTTVLAPRSWTSNPEPNVYAAWDEFAKQVVGTLMLRGEAILYATARGSDGYPARFIVLNPDWVNVERNGEGVVEYRVGGALLERGDVCHVKYETYPGDLRGHGPLEAAAYNLLGAAALEKYASNLATRGGVPWGVLTHPNRLNAEQALDLQNSWVSASARRDGAPAILSGGITLEPLTISPKDMALLELRTFDETRIAAVMGVPPFLVGLPQPSGLTYANATSLFDFHWRAMLRPLANTIASAVSQWALPRGTNLEFNRDEYVRPDLPERANAYSTLFAIVDPATGQRAITVDEIRRAERMVPVPLEGDTPSGDPSAVDIVTTGGS